MEGFEHLGQKVLLSLTFGAVGLFLFAVAFWLMAKLCAFSIRKEIEDDQNTSLAILMGSVIVGMSIIIATSIS
jgi:putative membrane protein